MRIHKKDGISPSFSFEHYCETMLLHLDCRVASEIFEQMEGSFLFCASSKTFLAKVFSASFTHAVRTVGSVTDEQAETFPDFAAVATA